MPIDVLSVSCAQLTRDLLAIAKFLLCFSKCVNEPLFHCQKLSKFSKTCFTTTKESALTPFNLALPQAPGRAIFTMADKWQPYYDVLNGANFSDIE